MLDEYAAGDADLKLNDGGRLEGLRFWRLLGIDTARRKATGESMRRVGETVECCLPDIGQKKWWGLETGEEN